MFFFLKKTLGAVMPNASFGIASSATTTIPVVAVVIFYESSPYAGNRSCCLGRR